jgi:hypothetical protein
METCRTCKQELDQKDKPSTKNCGGDCLRCMALFGDPDAIKEMHRIEPDSPDWEEDL